MAWVPKASAPPFFDVKAALAVAISGDPDWSWLSNWLPEITGGLYNTTVFCELGPNAPDPATAADLVPPTILDPIAFVQWHLQLAGKLTSLGHNRLFAAFCEETGIVPGPSGWCPSSFVHVSATQELGADGGYATFQVPAGNTSVRVRITERDASGGFNQRIDRGTSYPPWVGVDTLGGYDAGSVPSGWSTWAVGSGEVLRFLRYAGGQSTYEIQTNVCFNQGIEPIAQTDPGLPAPPTTPATTAGLAYEVDRIEQKCDFLISLIQLMLKLDPQLPPADVIDEPLEVADADTIIDLVDAIGVIVTVSNIQADTSIGFGAPLQFAHLGRTNFGTAVAWYPSVPITHTPMVIQPLPPGTTRMTVTVTPPVTATVTPLLRPK